MGVRLTLPICAYFSLFPPSSHTPLLFLRHHLQIHLSVSGNGTAMAVDFVSNSTSCSVSYRRHNTKDPFTTVGSVVGWRHEEIGVLHQATMFNLNKDTKYAYHIQCTDGSNSEVCSRCWCHACCP